MKTLSLLTLVALLSGCVNFAAAIKELKNDPAAVKIKVNTIYGTLEFERNFPTNWTPPAVIVETPTVHVFTRTNNAGP